MSARELDRRLRRLEAAAPPLPAPGLPAEVGGAIDARIIDLLRGLPDPDSPTWGPEHHAVLMEAAVLYRCRWTQHADTEPGHDLMADPAAVIEVARILRAVEMG